MLRSTLTILLAIAFIGATPAPVTWIRYYADKDHYWSGAYVKGVFRDCDNLQHTGKPFKVDRSNGQPCPVGSPLRAQIEANLRNEQLP